jgi:hypothetical protein
VFLNESERFRHAEEARFTDERRRGRTWEGFKAKPGLAVARTDEVLNHFKAAVREHFGSQNVHVDVFERRRANFDGKIYELVQATVYRDGPPDDVPEFIDGELTWRPRKPVYEAALTYESESGAIEVVARDRESREFLVRSFAQELLGTGAGQDRLPLRQYSLDILLRPFDFPTDPESLAKKAVSDFSQL